MSITKLLTGSTVILYCTHIQMYEAYNDPEGKNIEIEITISDQQPRSTFQCSEEVYKSHIQKLNEEIAILKKKVTINCLLISQAVVCVWVLLNVLLLTVLGLTHGQMGGWTIVLYSPLT